MTGQYTIGALGADEVGAASRLLGRAFRNNPLNRAVDDRSGERGRARHNAAGVRCQLVVARVHGRVLAARAAGLAGVVIAVPPRRDPVPLPPLFWRLRAAWSQGGRVARRWGHVAEVLGGLRPPDSHWYLSILGVRPEHQGRGCGSALVRAFETAVGPDAGYLETDVPANVGFYARFGFEVTGELDVFGVRVFRMLRPARGRATQGTLS